MLGFRACNLQHASLASGRAVFTSCGADPSKAKKRLSSPTPTPPACSSHHPPPVTVTRPSRGAPLASANSTSADKLSLDMTAPRRRPFLQALVPGTRWYDLITPTSSGVVNPFSILVAYGAWYTPPLYPTPITTLIASTPHVPVRPRPQGESCTIPPPHSLATE
jgi:hypothetical protein